MFTFTFFTVVVVVLIAIITRLVSVDVLGDDAVGVQWMDIGRQMKLYASHNSLIREVVDRLKAHW